MQTLVHVGWLLWALEAISLLVKQFALKVSHARAFERAVSEAEPVHTMHRLRILSNRGDWRDPIERHQDSMTTGIKVAFLAVVALVLWFFGAII